jgi:hypothetical protein
MAISPSKGSIANSLKKQAGGAPGVCAPPAQRRLVERARGQLFDTVSHGRELIEHGLSPKGFASMSVAR